MQFCLVTVEFLIGKPQNLDFKPDPAPFPWQAIFYPHSLAFMGWGYEVPPPVLEIEHSSVIVSLWPKGQRDSSRIFFLEERVSITKVVKNLYLLKFLRPHEKALEEDRKKQIFFQFYLTISKQKYTWWKGNYFFVAEMTDCFSVLNNLEVKEWSYLPCIVLQAVKFYGYICKVVLLYFMSNWKVYFFTIVPVEIQAILQEKIFKNY